MLRDVIPHGYPPILIKIGTVLMFLSFAFGAVMAIAAGMDAR